MTPQLLKAYRPDGSIRAIWTDKVAPAFREAGAIPHRASNVEVIEVGPNRGKFHVDFSKLADLTGNETYRVCLCQAFDTHGAAVAAEVRWLELNWVIATE